MLIFAADIVAPGASPETVVGELVLMLCLLFIALFNTFHPYWGPEYSGPPPPFWLIIVLNPSLCIYGYYKGT